MRTARAKRCVLSCGILVLVSCGLYCVMEVAQDEVIPPAEKEVMYAVITQLIPSGTDASTAETIMADAGFRCSKEYREGEVYLVCYRADWHSIAVVRESRVEFQLKSEQIANVEVHSALTGP